MVCEHVALASEPFKDRKYFKMLMAFFCVSCDRLRSLVMSNYRVCIYFFVNFDSAQSVFPLVCGG